MKLCKRKGPGEKFGDGMSGQDRGAVAISDALNLGLDILVRDNGNLRLEGLTVGGGTEFEAFKVLCVGVARENLRQHPLLDGVGVSGHFLNEPQRLRVLVTRRWTQWGRHRRINSHRWKKKLTN